MTTDSTIEPEQDGGASMSDVARPRPSGVGATAVGWSALGFPLAVHSVHHAFGDSVPLLSFYGFAVFGGLVLLVAGILASRNRDAFFATAFMIYGLFWLNQAAFGVLVMTHQIAPQDTAVNQAWMWLAGAVFTTYMATACFRLGVVPFVAFIALDLTYAFLTAGFFQGTMPGQGLVSLGGFTGVIAGLLAWYIAAAEIAKAVGTSWSLPLGRWHHTAAT